MDNRKVALITGITGQDGSYLAELLLEKGYDVHGTIRRSSTDYRERIAHLEGKPNFHLHYADLGDSMSIIQVMNKVKPTEVYNLAAQSHVQVSFDSPEFTADVDATGVLRILEAIRQLPQPAVMHLDHGAGIPEVVRAIRLGMTGVMIDASTLPLEENIAMTKLAAELCSYAGVPVEGELGHVGATKDEVLGNYTDVAEAERFVKETGVSALAVMVGTAHGRYKKAPVLDIQRIRDIREATGKLPLVLHGGSGVPDEQIRMAVEAGIRKVNFATDLCYAFLDQVMVTERTTVALDVFMREPIHAIRDYCISKIRLLGADKIL